MRVALVKRRTRSGYSYYADYYLNRKRVRKALGENKYLAKTQVEEIEKGLVMGIDLINSEKRNISVADLAREYLAATVFRRRKRTQYEEVNRFERSILPVLGHYRICEVSQRQLEEWVSRKTSENLRPGTINRHITSVKAMFKAAVEWEYLPKSPAQRLKKLKDVERSFHILERDTAQKLLEVAKEGPDYLYSILLLAMHTGMRRSELLHLRWQDLDFRREEIRVENMEGHQTKSGKVRVIPMTKAVLEYFKEKRGIGFLFGSVDGKPLGQLDKSFKTALKKAGVENFRFHDLRHTYASHLTMQGVPQRAVQELLGHGSGRMTERYSHLSPSHKHHAVKDFSLGLQSGVEKSGHVLVTFSK